jgi:outer membrane protein with beta-barrel domain
MKKSILGLCVILLVAVSVNTTSAKGLFGVEAAAALPMGDMGDVYGTGFGGGVSYEYFVAPAIAIRADVKYLSFGEKDDFPFTMTDIPFRVGANYYIGKPGGTQFYGGFMLGMHFLTISVDVDDLNWDWIASDDGSDTSTEFGIAPRVGIILPISGPKTLLNAGIEYNMIMAESTMSFLQINAGVQFAL